MNRAALEFESPVNSLPDETLTLDALSPGGRATIRALAGEDGITRRLRELGFLPGVEVEMIGRAPLGDPLAVFVRGSRMALRRRDARRIQIGIASPT